MLLILDETSTASLYAATSYSAYLEKEDEKDLLLITNFVSGEDKGKLQDFSEIPHPTSNGKLEIDAFNFHQKHKITSIYTKQEDLILRAAHLREALRIPGMKPEEAILFRDKVQMKEHLSKAGVKVPPFRRVFSPANILQFANKHGYPLIMKPTLGSASGGIRILKDREDAEAYLTNEFYDRIDEKGKVLDYSGDVCVEAFVGGTMFHGITNLTKVNGFATDGKIVNIWPFQYMKTNLGFTQGEYYGNLSISPSDKQYNQLGFVTQQILDGLPCPKYKGINLGIQYFTWSYSLLVKNFCCAKSLQGGTFDFLNLRPGGSIALLIDQQLGGKKLFPKLEFRFSNGLPVNIPAQDVNSWVGDVLIPRKLGTLEYLPESLDSPEVTLIPFATVGSTYNGFEMGKINTAVRIVARSEIGFEHLNHLLELSVERFNSLVKYSKL